MEPTKRAPVDSGAGRQRIADPAERAYGMSSEASGDRRETPGATEVFAVTVCAKGEPAEAADGADREARPRGFEPLTFGSIGGRSICSRGQYSCGISCTEAFLEVT